MKKTLSVALSGAALLLTLSACGDDSGKKLDDWAKGVCDQAAVQTKKINDANTAISKVNSAGKPEDVQKADAQAFDQISAAYKQLAVIVTTADAPPVDNGDQIKKDAVGDLTKLSTAYGTLKKQVDALNTADQGKFADGLKAVSVELGKVSKTGDQALDSLRQGDVGKAMSQQPGCRQGGGTPSVTSS